MGGDVNARDKSMWTPLHRCARKGHTDSCRYLLQNGANANLKTVELWTPLHCACVGGHPAVVKALVTALAPSDLQARTRLGQTPLYLAAYWGHLNSVRELLTAGADTTLKDSQGRLPGEDYHETVSTPLKIAVSNTLRTANPNPVVPLPSKASSDDLGELKRRVQKLEEIVAVLQAERQQPNHAVFHSQDRTAGVMPVTTSITTSAQASINAPTTPAPTPLALASPAPKTTVASTANVPISSAAVAPPANGGASGEAEDAKRRKL